MVYNYDYPANPPPPLPFRPHRVHCVDLTEFETNEFGRTCICTRNTHCHTNTRTRGDQLQINCKAKFSICQR